MSRSEEALKREVGWFGSFCMGYADVGADIYVAIGLVALYAAGASPLAFLAASVTYVCTGLAYAELASIYPYAGGAQVYAMKAFNDAVGFIAGWAVMLDYTIDVALFSLASAGYLSFFFPWLKGASLPLRLFGLNAKLSLLGLAALGLASILLLVNFVGIRESSLLNEVLVSLDLIVEALILVSGLILAFNVYLFLDQIKVVGADAVFSNVHYALKNLDVRSQNFIYGVTLAMTSFIGIESIAQAAEETKRPYKWIPRANKLSILSVMVFAVGLSALSMGIMPWERLAGAKEDPMAAIAGAIPILGKRLAPIVALTGFAICYVSTNTGVIGVSRVAFSMSKFGLIPRWFHKVHPKFKTPYRSIAMFGSIGALMALLGNLRLVADLYNFGALFSYMIVNLCLITLRNTEPEAYRPWKPPGDVKLKLWGRTLVLPAVGLVGFVSCAFIWGLILTYHREGRLLGAIWLFAGMALFCAYRRLSGIPLLSSKGKELVKPSGYVMNASVLVRTPEDYGAVTEALKRSLDKRFKITLLTILDPEELGIDGSAVESYRLLFKLSGDSRRELQSLVEELKGAGFECEAKVEVGPMEQILEDEAERSDLIVLIKRKTVKGDLEKERADSIYNILARRYPGKLMAIRRE